MAFSWKSFFNIRRSKGTDIRAPKSWIYNGSKTPVTEDTAMKVAAYHRGLVYISTQTAKLPWYIKDEKNNIVRGPLNSLLNVAPNEEMSAFFFKIFMCQNAIHHGNCYAEIERNNVGTPIAMWPLAPRDTELVRDISGKLFVKVTGDSAADVQAYIPYRDIFHIKNFHTKDGLTGEGLKSFASQTIGIAIAADQMASGIFNNGGIPSGIISVKGELSEEAQKRLVDSWNTQNNGRRAGGTRVLEDGATYTPIEIDSEMLQFLDSRKFGVLEIARFLGLPPTKLFDTTGTTFSNVENANLEVATDTIDVWATNFETEADIKILNYQYGGKYSEMDLDARFRGDMSTRGTYYKNMMAVGAMTPNQIREREGQPGYPEGDKYYIATNNFTPVDRMDEVIDSQIASKTQPKEPVKTEDETNKELAKAAVTYLTGR